MYYLFIEKDFVLFVNCDWQDINCIGRISKKKQIDFLSFIIKLFRNIFCFVVVWIWERLENCKRIRFKLKLFKTFFFKKIKHLFRTFLGTNSFGCKNVKAKWVLGLRNEMSLQRKSQHQSKNWFQLVLDWGFVVGRYSAWKKSNNEILPNEKKLLKVIR